MYVLKGVKVGRGNVNVRRIRDFLRIPYLYTIPDDYTPGDESYKDHPDYLEDEKVDEELRIIANQVADYMTTTTGFTILNPRYEYIFDTKDITDGIVKIWENPITEINLITDYPDASALVAGTLEYTDEPYCFKLSVPDGKHVMSLSIGSSVSTKALYRSGDRFFNDETKGIPYSDTIVGTIGSATRLYEVLIDHFYQNRGIVQIGTIVAKMPTSHDALVSSVQALVPYQSSVLDFTYTP